MRNQDKFRGCLIGGAAGDALGYTVEFMQEGQIFSKYGNQGITDYSLKNGIALYHSKVAAQNILGLSTQNQMNAVYLTYGPRLA